MEKDVEQDLIWIGLEAMIDPAREDVVQALLDCKTAGIRVVMITGDNPLTAQAIADEIGLTSKKVMEGNMLDNISDQELEEELKSRKMRTLIGDEIGRAHV